ncbi:MAG TPA: MBL fold metallo-hydrolase [Kineosporiaceae bacterium]|nr:MBL fold metallo-hydrolase [Kineosporiaceae bacterium]
MRVTVVGCSGSFPGPHSAASCYLIEVEDRDRTWRIVLDLGSGALGPLQQMVALHQIDAVLISHLHPDHFMDLCGLYVARRYHPAGASGVPLPVYGPPHTGDRVLQAYGPDAADELASVYDIRPLSDGGQVLVGPVTITTRLVEHPVVAFGMRIEYDGRVLAYSGDTDACEALLDLAHGADLLLAEASYQEGRDETRGVHLTGRRAGEAARDAGARRLVLTHLPVWTDADVVLAEAKQVYLGPVEAAVPGASYVLEDVRVR